MTDVSRSGHAALCLCAFALGPVSATMLPSLLGSRGPAEASASSGPMPMQPEAIEQPALPVLVIDEDQQRVIDAVQPLASMSLTDSPFGSGPTQAAIDEPGEMPTDTDVTYPDFQLGTILDGPTGAVASISGKLVRAGDVLESGWRVGSIDPDARRITLLHESGAEHSLRMRTPFGEQ
ncbi:MAG: hypothetical protein AAF297_02840 [Planctomycetota bacterium]